MATTNLSVYKKKFHSTLNVLDLNSKCVDSPITELSNLKWKIQFAKKSANGDKGTETLVVHLVSIFYREPTKWSCQAQATIRLLQKDGQADKAVVKHSSTKTFDKENPSHGVDGFIKWYDLLQEYVQDDQAKFEVEISTWPLKRKREPCNDKNVMSTEFLMAIESVSNLKECCSREVVLQGIRWKVKCKKEKEHLAIYLYGDSSDMDANWYYTVDSTFSLSSFDSSVNSITRHLGYIFDARRINRGFSQFLKWSEFVDKEKNYVSKDRANLFVELNVEPKPMWKIQRQTPTNVGPSLDCCICLDNFTSGNIFSVKCGHLFCKPCFNKSIARRKVCPTCQTAITSAQLHPIFF